MTETNSSSSRRIAKNTVMLYIRMLLTMVVSLYTSRIVLNTLGVEDYGIHNVVAGFVTMFGFLNSAMAAATQRFLSFEIGKKDKNKLRNVFSMSINIHFVIAFVILFFAGTIGLWLLNTKLTIPAERVSAAHWVYYFSILALVVNIVSVPYNAMIIAHERMNVFAWISILDVSLKLLIVFMLQWLDYDKLKLYAVLMFSVSIIIRVIYGAYCNYTFKESKYRFYWDKPLFKTLISFAGWNLWGHSASVIMGQGANVLLNIFFGPVVNAAYGVSLSIKSAVYQFSQNFMVALNPPIVKSFAANDLKYMHKLIIRGAKYSYFLLFVLSLPILLETEIILRLWLKQVPVYAVVFTRLSIINILIESISRPLMSAAQASGKIKLYQSVVGGLLILNLPVSYIFLKLGFPPQTIFLVMITIAIVALFIRLKILRPLIQLSISQYFKEVLYRIIPTTIAAIILPLFIYITIEESFYRFIIIGFTSVVLVTLSIYFIGLEDSEKVFAKRKISDILRKIR